MQCKTHLVHIFHIFFFVNHIFVYPLPNLVPRSHSVLRRGGSGYEITSLPSHSLSQLLMDTSMKAALFLSQTISATKCCSRWELICFLQDYNCSLKNPALMGKIMWSSELYSVILPRFASALPSLLELNFTNRGYICFFN